MVPAHHCAEVERHEFAAAKDLLGGAAMRERRAYPAGDDGVKCLLVRAVPPHVELQLQRDLPLPDARSQVPLDMRESGIGNRYRLANAREFVRILDPTQPVDAGHRHQLCRSQRGPELIILFVRKPVALEADAPQFTTADDLRHNVRGLAGHLDDLPSGSLGGRLLDITEINQQERLARGDQRDAGRACESGEIGPIFPVMNQDAVEMMFGQQGAQAIESEHTSILSLYRRLPWAF